MQAIYEYTGIVETVCELQTFASGFTKRDLVLTDDIDVQTKYPNHIAFTFKKDNTSLLDKVQKGQRAKVRFAIDGRVWQDPKTGNNRYFTDLTALKLELLDADGSSTEPMPEPADVPEDVLAGDVDDLPF
jgi:hypothetical protein